MHRAYEPLKPATNKYLQKRWDQTHYDEHRSKVRAARPVVDTKGMRTPAHIQLKLKKRQVEDERTAIIERDNHLLATRLSEIRRSKGLVDHRNDHQEHSLNSERRREELLQVTRQNMGIFQRITARQSEYRRQLWEEDWERAERRRDDIARYPRGVTNWQRQRKTVKFSGTESEQSENSSSATSNGSHSTSEEEEGEGEEELKQ